MNLVFQTLDRVFLDGVELNYLGDAEGGPLFSRVNANDGAALELIPAADLMQLMDHGRLIVMADARKSRRRK